MSDIKQKIFKEFRLMNDGEKTGAPPAGRRRPVLFVSDTAFSPPTDVWETDSEICIMVEIADMDFSDIRVQYCDGEVEVSGCRPEPDLLKKSRIIKFYKKEIDYGDFRIRIKMNTRIDQKSSRAEYKNGILSVRLPKIRRANQSTNHEIPVQTG